MILMDAIKKRRAVRSYLSKAVSDELLLEVLEAARYAPSGGDSQSWLFGVVRDKATKELLAKAAGNQGWISEAPAIIACCARLDKDMATLPEDDFGLIVNNTRFGDEFINYMNQCPDRKMVATFWSNGVPLIPGEHIALAAASKGLSTCWIGYLDLRKANEILGLPDDVVCLFLMPIGYAAEEPGEIYRKTLDEIIFYEKWHKA